MAEVEFGDSELFEQLDEETAPQASHIRFDQAEDWDVEPGSLKEHLSRCEETIAQLRLENQELRRKLSVLSRPSGLSVNDTFDGPLLQILFMNHVVSTQYHQEIEDFLSNLAEKYEEQRKANPEKTNFNVKPQPSSILLEESGTTTVDNIKKIKEAFSVVGSVLYFTNFCLDKLGQPLLNENPQLTDGWEVPKYQQVFSQIVSLDGQEVQVKAKRPKPCCFNCGSEEHQLKDCPKPRDLVHIGMKRKEFMDSCGEAGNQNYQQRYHAEVAERFAKFKPGVISEELHEALGITNNHLPQFIYRMRQLGYPPGWLKDAELENSGLSLYDGRDTSDGEIKEDLLANKHVSYDISKLVSYPGFNIAPAPGIADDWRSFGSIPMQPSHQRDYFADYLNCNFPKPNHNSNHKRTLSQSRTEKKRQKTSGNSKAGSPVDMDVGSDSDASYRSPASQGFKFQPPLPPAFLCNTPPQQHHRNPPSTPPNFIPPPPPTPTPPPLPKGTPPPTPTRGSPLLHSRGVSHLETQVAVSMDEDTLTLEELEEQQRLIWAALENAESTNSDSDVPAPLNGNSAHSDRTDMDISTGEEMASLEKETKPSDVVIEQIAQGLDKNVPLVPEENSLKEDIDDTNVLEKAVVGSNGTGTINKNTSEENEDTTEEATFVDPYISSSNVPDRSKFAEGIAPFEYDNMSESTGVYLRLRNVLKNSPRNQQKIKKVI